MNILEFKHILPTDINLVGGKGASLGKLSQFGMPVPPGFVVTTDVYRKFSKEDLPLEVEEEILKSFDDLETKRVAVRSSAVAEDSSKNSWAGQLESYLNVSREELLQRIRDCWDSIRSDRALSYASGQNLTEDELVVAVVVQKMVDSEAAGVMFTINPVTKNSGELMIEASFGLGEYLVQGMITPDNLIVDKENLRVKNIDLGTQEKMLKFLEGKNQEVFIPKKMGSKQVLTFGQIQELAKMGLQIEKYYGRPQDIEWALENGKLYILQSRPVTS